MYETSPGRIVLALHGDERVALGGPSVRVPRMAEMMQAYGYDAHVLALPDVDLASAKLVHGFNVWNPHSALAMARRVRQMELPFVFSPIFLDLSETDLWNRRLPLLFEQEPRECDLDGLIAEEVRGFAAAFGSVSQQPIAGYHAIVRELINLSDHVVHLSNFERLALERIGAVATSSSIIRNPVAADEFANADPELFIERFGLRDFVLCVARVEPRKNQLMLLHALRETGLPVVLVGDEPNAAYSRLLERYASDHVHRLGRLERDSGMLQSALAAARVVVLPSWSEGAPLAALEAAAAGAALVVSDRSGEREYLGAHALYCDPAKPASIREAVLAAWGMTDDQKIAAQHFVRDQYGWRQHVQGTLQAYGRAQRGYGLSQAFARLGMSETASVFPLLKSVRTASRDACEQARLALEHLGGRAVSITHNDMKSGEKDAAAVLYIEPYRVLAYIRGDETPCLEAIEAIRHFAETHQLKLVVMLAGVTVSEEDLPKEAADLRDLVADAAQIICPTVEMCDAMRRFCLAEDFLRPRIDLVAGFEDGRKIHDLLSSDMPLSVIDDAYISGDRLAFGRHAPRRGAALGEGWLPRQETEVWSEAIVARLGLKTCSPGPSVLAITARMPVYGSDIGVCRVDVDGVKVGELLFGDTRLRTFCLTLPSSVEKDGMTIDFRVDSLRTFSDRKTSVGLALHALALERRDEPFLSLEQQLAPIGTGFDLTHWSSASLLVEGASQDGVWGMHGDQGATRFVLGRVSDNERADIRLRLRCRPVASSKVPLHARVLVNGQSLGIIDAFTDEVLDYEFVLPEAQTSSLCMIVDIVASDSRSPSSLGIGEEKRCFSVGVFSAAILVGVDDVPAVNRNSIFCFGDDASTPVDTDELIPGEWHAREANGRWSNGTSARLRLRAPDAELGGYLVRVHAVCRPVAGCVRSMSLWAGDRMIARQRFGEQAGILEGYAPNVVLRGGYMDLRLSTETGFTPWVEDGTPDDRRLGFHLQKVELRVARKPTVLRRLVTSVSRSIRGLKSTRP